MIELLGTGGERLEDGAASGGRSGSRPKPAKESDI